MGEAARKIDAMMSEPATVRKEHFGDPKGDFDAAVAKAVDEKLAKFRDEMLAVAQPKTAGLELLGPLMEQMGLKLADIADQNNGRTIGQRVDPDLQQRREESKKEMIALIDSAQKRGAMPEYRLKGAVILDHSKIEPFYIDPATRVAKETEIQFDGIPNEQMIPIDDEAKAIYDAYRGWIGNLKKVVPEDRLGITATGVVVKNGAVQQRREVRPGGEANAADAPRRATVRTSHLHRVGTEKRILGSIHPPVLVVAG